MEHHEKSRELQLTVFKVIAIYTFLHDSKTWIKMIKVQIKFENEMKF